MVCVIVRYFSLLLLEQRREKANATVSLRVHGLRLYTGETIHRPTVRHWGELYVDECILWTEDADCSTRTYRALAQDQ